MKLYKNTLIISSIVFGICVLLSVVFNFACISDLKIITFFSDYIIGIACSIIVVIITTFLQFKHEQKKALDSILSDVRCFLLHCHLAAISLDPEEKATERLWDYHYEKLEDEIRNISIQLSEIEWFSKKNAQAAFKLQKSTILIRIDMAKEPHPKRSIEYILRTPSIKDLKENAVALASPNSHDAQEIYSNYEKMLSELESLKEKGVTILSKEDAQ